MPKKWDMNEQPENEPVENEPDEPVEAILERIRVLQEKIRKPRWDIRPWADRDEDTK